MSEDLKGIPDVEGLAAFMDQEKAPQVEKAEVKAEPKEQPQGEVTLGQFKTPEDLLKSYKEIQGYTTRVSQENKTLKEQMEQIKSQMEMLSYQTPVQQPRPQSQSWDDTFINKPEEAVRVTAREEARREMVAMQIESVLQEEAMKTAQPGAPMNPEFDERYNYAKYLGTNYYPQLVQSSAGVRKLFELADKMRKEQMTSRAHKSLSALLGEDVDLEKFKKLVQKDTTENVKGGQQFAYMPETSTSRNRTEPEKPTFDSSINEATQRGDADTVLSLLFQKKFSGG